MCIRDSARLRDVELREGELGGDLGVGGGEGQFARVAFFGGDEFDAGELHARRAGGDSAGDEVDGGEEGRTIASDRQGGLRRTPTARAKTAYNTDLKNNRSSRTADGAAHPDMQLNVMSHRMVAFLAQDPALEPLAGDQLYLDLDLSEGNLPAGSQLAFGDPDAPGAVIEVTEQPHTGCAKFVARFGPDAMRFVNGRVGRPRRLRGLNARVVLAGQIHTGDLVTVRRLS